MDNSCDTIQKLNPEECRKESHESSEEEIEDNVRTDGFLRNKDSDDETDSALESVDKCCDNSDKKQENDYKELKECKTVYLTTDPKETVVVSVVSANSTGDSLSKTATKTKPKDEKKPSKAFPNTPKWGESVGILDETGRPKRIVNLSEVKNYIQLRMRYDTTFKFYFSLVDNRYPQLYRCYDTGEQRWRMRYNIFVEGMFGPKKAEPVVLHVGEIMIYFDIGKRFTNPYYANCSFYANYCPLYTQVDTSRLTKMIIQLHDILTSRLILQLKFPVGSKTIRNTDHLYFRFLLRQKEMMSELEYINKSWTPSGKWLTIDTKRRNSETNSTSNRRPVDRRRRDIDVRPNRTRGGEERPRSGSRLRNYRSDEPVVKRIEDRIDRRFVNSNLKRNTRSNRRSDEIYVRNPLREKSSNFDPKMAVDRVELKSSLKKTFQRRNRSSDRSDANEYSNARAVNDLRSDRNLERRSRPKTRRR